MLYLMPDDLVPFLVAVSCLTGMEPECVKGLRADCLASPARGFVSIRYLKRRARGHEDQSVRVSDGGSLRHPGGLIRLALRLTQRGRDHSRLHRPVGRRRRGDAARVLRHRASGSGGTSARG